jgi:SulP family sulfate permease
VIIGFMAGAAFLLAIGQIGNALGLRGKGSGDMQVLHRLWLTLFYGDHVNTKALFISGLAVILAVVLRKMVQRYKLPLVDMLLVLVITGVVAYVAGWSTPGPGGATAVSIAGKIPANLPAPHIPEIKTAWFGELSKGALAIAFVGLIEALSIAKALANLSKQKLDYNRQILAEGLANLTGGFFQCIPGSGSLSRSAINYQAGAATRFSGVVTAAVVAVAVLLFASLLRYIPNPALSGLLLVTAVRLVDFKRLFYAVRATRYDAGLVLVTALSAVLIDLDTAVLLGVALSVLLFLPRAAKMKGSELIVTPERVVRERLPTDAAVDPYLLIYDLEGELFFGAAPELDRYFDALKSRIEAQGVKFLILRLKRVRGPDVVCIERIEHFLREEAARGVSVLLAGVRADTLRILQNIRFETWFPASQIFPEEETEHSATLKAVRYALAKLHPTSAEQQAREARQDVEVPQELYYLV